MLELAIIQYNCGNANAGACRPFFDSIAQANHQVIALQEPGYNKHTKSTYKPQGYSLAYEPAPTTKVAFLVSRALQEADWSWKSYGPHVAALSLRAECGTVTIINVYNPRSTTQIPAWQAITQALHEAEGETILLGDFNIHHPKWGGRQAAREPQGDQLLTATGARGLRLATPQGERTWKRGISESVIDLTFATTPLCERLLFCGTQERWALTHDHFPIEARFDIALHTPTQRRGYDLAKLRASELVAHVKASNWNTATTPLVALQEAIQEGMQRFCPRKKGPPPERKAWSPEASRLVAGVRQARRRVTAHNHQVDRVTHRALSNRLKKVI
jgi:Endonuclease-reverse transcriptase